MEPLIQKQLSCGQLTQNWPETLSNGTNNSCICILRGELGCTLVEVCYNGQSNLTTTPCWHSWMFPSNSRVHVPAQQGKLKPTLHVDNPSSESNLGFLAQLHILALEYSSFRRLNKDARYSNKMNAVKVFALLSQVLLGRKTCFQICYLPISYCQNGLFLLSYTKEKCNASKNLASTY